MGQALRRTVVITNPQGLHMRPAAAFAESAARFESAVTVARAGNLVDGKDMLQLLLLAAECGTELELEAIGPDAAVALDALAQILATIPPDVDE
jgi:phosphotransferase system HPr (HPr) family protein